MEGVLLPMPKVCTQICMLRPLTNAQSKKVVLALNVLCITNIAKKSQFDIHYNHSKMTVSNAYSRKSEQESTNCQRALKEV